jgi:transposase
VASGVALTAEQRRRIVRGDERGYSPEEIARFIPCSISAVHKWLHCWDEEGEAGLLDKPCKARQPSHVTPDEVVEIIIALVEEDPTILLSTLAKQVSELRWPNHEHRMKTRTIALLLQRSGYHKTDVWSKGGK